MDVTDKGRSPAGAGVWALATAGCLLAGAGALPTGHAPFAASIAAGPFVWLKGTLLLLGLLACLAALIWGGFFRGWPKGKALQQRLSDVFRQTPPGHWGSLAVVLLLGTLLRALYVARAAEHDEVYTYLWHARLPLWTLLTEYGPTNNNHVLQTYAMAACTRILGDGIVVIRLPALLAGVALLPLVYASLRVIHGRDLALLATAFLTATSEAIQYSCNGRGYTMQAALLMAALLGGALWLRGGRWQAPALLVLVVGCAASLFTVPTAALGVTGLFLWLGTAALLRGREVGWALLQLFLAGLAVVVGTLTLYFPLLVLPGVGIVTQNEYSRSLPWGEFTDGLPYWLGLTATAWTIEWPQGVGAWVLGAAGLGLLAEPKRRFAAPPLGASLLAGAALVLAYQRALPFPRNWFAFLPLVGLGLGSLVWWGLRGLERARSGRPLLATAVLMVAPTVAAAHAVVTLRADSVQTFDQTGMFRSLDAFFTILRREAGPEDPVVVTLPPRDQLRWMNERAGSPLRRINQGPTPGTWNIWILAKKQNATPTLDAAMTRLGIPKERLVLVYEDDTGILYRVPRGAR